MNRKDIQDLFSTWGRSKRQNPTHNDELQGNMFAKLQSTSFEHAPASPGRPWFAMAFTGLAVVALFMVQSTSVFNNREVYTAQDSATVSSEEKGGASPSMIAPYPPSDSYYPYYPQGNPITDTREFLKTYYNANIRTRNVDQLASRLQTTIRGLGGRIDGASSSKRWGSISFAIPADKFEAFRSDVKSMVRGKFLLEDVRTENLLPQKQSIEERRTAIEKMIADWQTERSQLVATHSQTAASLRSQLNTIAAELTALRAEQTSDPARQSAIAARITVLENQRALVNSRLASENSSYANQLGALDFNIKNAKADLEGVGKDDQRLDANIATVTGTISLSWISIWEVLSLYLTPYWLPVLLAVAAIVSYLLHRRRLYRV